MVDLENLKKTLNELNLKELSPEELKSLAAVLQGMQTRIRVSQATMRCGPYPPRSTTGS